MKRHRNKIVGRKHWKNIAKIIKNNGFMSSG